MFPNSKELSCPESVSALSPASGLIRTASVPVNLQRCSDQSFLYCDVKDQLITNILECTINPQSAFKTENVEQFMGVYEYYCFGDDHVFLVNREGDIAYYDQLTKDTTFMEKQHPSLFHPLQVHNIGEAFLSCGGDVKNSQGESQKIVKVWRPFQENELDMKARIVTGHAKPIENSLILGRNRLVTMSTDFTLRTIHLSTAQVEAIPISMMYYSGCEVDWNSALLGGIGASLTVFDLRGKKVMRTAKLPFAVTQISAFCRINSHNYLFANASSLYQLDIRTLTAQKMGEYEGERISAIKVLSPTTLLLGNHDRSLQIWECT